jgi:hypothetical protein
MESLYFFKLDTKKNPNICQDNFYQLVVRSESLFYIFYYCFFEEVQKEKEMECVSTECSIMNAIILEKKTM